MYILFLLIAGDEIVAINGTSVVGLTNSEVLDLIQCEADTTVVYITARRHVMQRTNR